MDFPICSLENNIETQSVGSALPWPGKGCLSCWLEEIYIKPQSPPTVLPSHDFDRPSLRSQAQKIDAEVITSTTPFSPCTFDPTRQSDLDTTSGMATPVVKAPAVTDADMAYPRAMWRCCRCQNTNLGVPILGVTKCKAVVCHDEVTLEPHKFCNIRCVAHESDEANAKGIL